MPLSKPALRQQRHQRQIDLRGYQRDDGLWDIEAHLVDTKSYSFPSKHRDYIAAGEPVHDMWLRLTLDTAMIVIDVEAVINSSPFRTCPEITQRFKQLIGEQIKPGWTKRCRKLLGGTQGCTHLLELLGPVATTAFQTIHGGKQATDRDENQRPALLNTCHAFADNGEVVKEMYPAFYHKPKCSSSDPT